MVELYQAWHASGVDFHYVSSSPWQLYQPLADLYMRSNFPAAVCICVTFVCAMKCSNVGDRCETQEGGIIRAILKWLPKRRFVLIGDSGERDPEIYRFLAKRFPDQIAAILIRNLHSRPLDAGRLRKLSHLQSQCEVRVFSKPQKSPTSPPGWLMVVSC